MNRDVYTVKLGADITVPVAVPGQKKPVKVCLRKGSGFPIVERVEQKGVGYLVVLSSYGQLLVSDSDPHKVAHVNAPSDIPLEQFIVENAGLFIKGQFVPFGTKE